MSAKSPLLVLASRNLKKSGEIRDLLAPYGFPLKSVAEFPGVGEVDEDGETFAANAAKKAREVAIATGQWAIGEDSGLQVDALNGDPGVLSARYSGEGATDEKNNLKLQEALRGVPDARRGAGYVCHVAVADPTGKIHLSFEDTCRGRIISEPRGENGFGYDPYFLVREYHETFGQLSPIVKKYLSHRARAFRRLIPELQKLFERLGP
ncbi:Non-canonical purine NTP pyrophosphatase [Caulifigura coniformis]|uniref:dITP/XTP pyrophosphatase n=1 Tax=Caulifigura coniformis TaxID=2527983 RepID=A0A517SH64_9PLAN|nr:non-canonical purine NTP pyrophosphatase [Caulifigura coniformis]QDT55468.1 Non-canonical purine NTP pyrophosphatase [Caulifigura coniformis]